MNPLIKSSNEYKDFLKEDDEIKEDILNQGFIINENKYKVLEPKINNNNINDINELGSKFDQNNLNIDSTLCSGYNGYKNCDTTFLKLKCVGKESYYLNPIPKKDRNYQVQNIVKEHNNMINYYDKYENIKVNNYYDNHLNEYDNFKEKMEFQNYKLQKELDKLKQNLEEFKKQEKETVLNQIIGEYNKLKNKYFALNETYFRLKKENDVLKNINKDLNKKIIQMNQYIKNENFNKILLKFDDLRKKNRELKNKLKSKSSFIKEKNIMHFELHFISEVTKMGDDKSKSNKCFLTPHKCDEKNKLKEDKINQEEDKKLNFPLKKQLNNNNCNIIKANEDYNKKLFDKSFVLTNLNNEINNNEMNENSNSLEDNYNSLKEKYKNLYNSYINILDTFNNIISQKDFNNQSYNGNSFCIFNNLSGNLNDIPNYNFTNINQNEDTNFIFKKKKINSIYSYFYVNSIIYCLLHVNKLTEYFLNDYPKNALELKQKNKVIISKGQISDTFHYLIQEIVKNNGKYSLQNFLPLKNFKEIICTYNQKIPNLSCLKFLNNLLKIFHEELNYFGDKKVLKSRTCKSVNEFNKEYNMNNSSIISELFSGTLENIRQCKTCKITNSDYSKFNIISFETNKYDKKVFNIYNGFEDIEKTESLSFLCHKCKKPCEFECSLKIAEPPKELIININYNNESKPSKINFDKKIDITKFVCPDFGTSNEYRINCVCYKTETKNVSFCWNKNNEKWYLFDDSSFNECEEKNIYLEAPYLLLYERL